METPPVLATNTVHHKKNRVVFHELVLLQENVFGSPAWVRRGPGGRRSRLHFLVCVNVLSLYRDRNKASNAAAKWSLHPRWYPRISLDLTPRAYEEVVLGVRNFPTRNYDQSHHHLVMSRVHALQQLDPTAYIIASCHHHQHFCYNEHKFKFEPLSTPPRNRVQRMPLFSLCLCVNREKWAFSASLTILHPFLRIVSRSEILLPYCNFISFFIFHKASVGQWENN